MYVHITITKSYLFYLQGNNEVTKYEMGSFWVEGAYGTRETGELLFEKLDHTNEGVLTREMIEDLFMELDCSEYNDYLAMELFSCR